MKSGIYCIINNVNNKIYIGQALNLKKRFKEHKRTLKNNTHANEHLQNAYNKYGIENFIFKVIIFCDVTELDKYENFFIKIFHATNREKGYNILQYANQNPATIPEVKDKISKAVKGRKHTQEWKDKASYWNTGDKNAMYGKPGTWLGKRFSEQHKKRISDALRKDLPSGHDLYKEWYQDNKTTDELGKKYGCSKTCISDHIKECGYNLQGIKTGNKHHAYTGLAVVQKAGFDGYSHKQKYQLYYCGNIVKQSIYKDLLEKVADMINNDVSMDEIDIFFKEQNSIYQSRDANVSGIYRVRKKKNNQCAQGFIWVYTYNDENGKQKTLSSVDLDKLKKKVLDKKLEWIEFK